MKIVKFGGSSLANGEQLSKVIDIMQADPTRQVLVVSAPGKRSNDDIKVTDLLIKYANNIDNTKLENQIINRYREIANYFTLPANKFSHIADEIANLKYKKYPNDEYRLAAFKAHGEKLNAMLIALIFNHLHLPAIYGDPLALGITVTGTPGAASIHPSTYQNISRFPFQGHYLIVPGFYGYTTSHNIATFARGGSDITGSILARGLKAELYENFTDVSAIYAANPQIIKNPQPINQMSYKEMRELAYAGFQVFNDEAIIPVIEGNIPINVKNTNQPTDPGTLIVPPTQLKVTNEITGVASSKRFAAIYLHRYLLNKEVGFTLKILKILLKYNISYEHMPSGIDDLTIIFDKSQTTPKQIKQLLHDIQTTIKPDILNFLDNYTIIMIVGEGMRNKSGVLAHILAPLAAANIGIQMINQGASRISVMLGVTQENANRAVQVIYDAYFD
ncbi:aspartate kinase [Weissella beninensis]|uniref:Aspartokinase n=1 Tax=Periweissella beninensis TaxID=504936 RepID=A0ABT0VJ96_9LACO|nr:aspartate kinase [Periweissella beninensis]MBM7543498.1 aspartate kinase [Periweissella beninensis]MCM2436480.1 aspartate kinase [Periweissella beninensis]